MLSRAERTEIIVEQRFYDKYGKRMFRNLKSGMDSFLRNGSGRQLYVALRTLLGPYVSGTRRIEHPRFVMTFQMEREEFTFDVDAMSLIVEVRDASGDCRFRDDAISERWIYWLPVVFGLDF